MEAVVPPQVTAELTQILSNLVLGDNEIRANAEKAVNDRLSQTPELYLLALAQFATSADTEVSLSTIERLLLHSLAHEPSLAVRHKAVDTVTDLANNAMSRGRPWHALQQQAFAMAENEDPAARESAYRVFSGSPNLIMDLQPETVLSLLHKGLEDPGSVEVRGDRFGSSATLYEPQFPLHSAFFLRQRKAVQYLTMMLWIDPFPVVRMPHALFDSCSTDSSASKDPMAQ
ncbi:hypothetical protein EIP86_000219 [Pleurotus ostreatoroseus]|nr:hypothetical protein EIP86_000219 [Pleurotus ostreatoroseus]